MQLGKTSKPIASQSEAVHRTPHAADSALGPFFTKISAYDLRQEDLPGLEVRNMESSRERLHLCVLASLVFYVCVTLAMSGRVIAMIDSAWLRGKEVLDSKGPPFLCRMTK